MTALEVYKRDIAFMQYANEHPEMKKKDICIHFGIPVSSYPHRESMFIKMQEAKKRLDERLFDALITTSESISIFTRTYKIFKNCNVRTVAEFEWLFNNRIVKLTSTGRHNITWFSDSLLDELVDVYMALYEAGYINNTVIVDKASDILGIEPTKENIQTLSNYIKKRIKGENPCKTLTADTSSIA